jgi:hypothetical protein
MPPCVSFDVLDMQKVPTIYDGQIASSLARRSEIRLSLQITAFFNACSALSLMRLPAIALVNLRSELDRHVDDLIFTACQSTTTKSLASQSSAVPMDQSREVYPGHSHDGEMSSAKCHREYLDTLSSCYA